MASVAAADEAPRSRCREFIRTVVSIAPQDIEPFAEKHYTINELAWMWKLSGEFVRQLIQHEPGVTEWVRQQPGRRRYRVLRIPQSVAERVYRRAVAKATDEAVIGVGSTGRKR